MITNRIFSLAAILLVLLGGVLVVKSLILHDPVVKLESAPALSGQITQSIGALGDGQLPVINKDYSLNTVYFDGKNWAVANIKSLGSRVTSGIVILEKQNGNYAVVLGPGTAFSRNELGSLPEEVTAYVMTRVGVYDNVPN